MAISLNDGSWQGWMREVEDGRAALVCGREAWVGGAKSGGSEGIVKSSVAVMWIGVQQDDGRCGDVCSICAK